jgi:hypothetical protein
MGQQQRDTELFHLAELIYLTGKRTGRPSSPTRRVNVWAKG